MSNPTQKTKSRCLVEASAWRFRLSEEDVESTPEFERWLLADAGHQDAWDRVQGAWDFIGEHEAAPEALEWRRIALGNAQKAARSRWLAPTRGRPPLVRIAAAVLGVGACLALFAWYIQHPDVYSTQLAERRMVTLADGSRIELDSSTELLVRYSTHARELTLVRGQARFDVAHDVERPFSVTAGSEKVVAVGTTFNVDLSGSKVIVTLIEGHVVVLQKAPAPSFDTLMGPVRRVERSKHDVELNPGQRLEASAGGGSHVMAANVERSIAWQSGQLIFDDDPLSTVVEQANRYARRPLVLRDAAVGSLRMSGVFNTDDIDDLVDTLTRYLPVSAEVRDGTTYLSHR